MKFKKWLVILAIMLVVPLYGSHTKNTAFLSTGETIAASATATNGSEITSVNVPVAEANIALILITFTGDGSMDGSDIDFYFQVSYDGGTTYTTDELFIIDVASDAAHASNVVRHAELVNLYGVSHVRLWKIVNGDAANQITEANASISW